MTTKYESDNLRETNIHRAWAFSAVLGILIIFTAMVLTAPVELHLSLEIPYDKIVIQNITITFNESLKGNLTVRFPSYIVWRGLGG